jgi:hypothetical protein
VLNIQCAFTNEISGLIYFYGGSLKMSSNYNTCINAGSLVFTTNPSSNNNFIIANCFTNTGSINLGTDYYLNVIGMSSTSYFYNSGNITLYGSSLYNNNPSTLVITINFYNTGSIQGQEGPNSVITNNSGQITTGQINVIDGGQYISNAPPNSC